MSSAAEPVTVVMAVRNGGRYLRAAIESILAQTYRAFRFVIVDDASSDETREIVRSHDDPRLELVSLERNVGQTAALNVGVRRASSRWIARMDADDYSAPTRLEEQMALAEREPSLGCVGTFAWLFREDPRVVEGVIEKPLDDAAIRRRFWRVIPLIHGTLIMRRELLLEAGGYDERYRYSADWDLYHRLLARCRAANLSTPLVGIRRHPDQKSFLKASLDETIEIFSTVLATKACARRDRAAVRESLSFTYVERARGGWSAGKPGAMVGDLGQAIRWSPATAFRSLVAPAVPARLRALVRRGR